MLEYLVYSRRNAREFSLEDGPPFLLTRASSYDTGQTHWEFCYMKDGHFYFWTSYIGNRCTWDWLNDIKTRLSYVLSWNIIGYIVVHKGVDLGVFMELGIPIRPWQFTRPMANEVDHSHYIYWIPTRTSRRLVRKFYHD